MRIYKSRAKLLSGTSYEEVLSAAKKEQKKIEKLTKRQPYVRSAYFNKDKIFITPLFMTHIMQKSLTVRTKRLKLYNAAIDLMRNSRCEPETIFRKDNLSSLTHRFYGVTKDKVEFCVQVKQDKRSGRKDFLSVYERKSS